MDRVGLARRIIDFGLTQADLELGRDIGLAGADRPGAGLGGSVATR